MTKRPFSLDTAREIEAMLNYLLKPSKIIERMASMPEVQDLSDSLRSGRFSDEELLYHFNIVQSDSYRPEYSLAFCVACKDHGSVGAKSILSQVSRSPWIDVTNCVDLL